jgi:hypothetical protein
MKKLLVFSTVCLAILLSSEASAFECFWKHNQQQVVNVPVIQYVPVPVTYYYTPVVVQPVTVPVVIRPIVQEVLVPRVQYLVTPVINYEYHRVYRY